MQENVPAYGENATQPTQQPIQYTKRKQFLFFKIRSKPIRPSDSAPKKSAKASKTGGITLLQWISALVIAVAALFVTSRLGFSFIVSGAVGVGIYVVIFGLLSVGSSKRVKTEIIKEQIKGGVMPATAREVKPSGTQAASKGENRRYFGGQTGVAGQQGTAQQTGGPYQGTYQEYDAKKRKTRVDWRGVPITGTVQPTDYGQVNYHPKQDKAAEKPVGKGPFSSYINGVVKKRRNLEVELREVGIKKSPYEFVKTMVIYAAIITVVIVVTLGVVLDVVGAPVFLAPLLGIAVYMAMFNRFMLYPTQRTKVTGKLVERDILFAARDIVIGMRSGMPLYNAMTAVSTGYGEASRQFSKIIELVQLGMPIEQAMDETSSKSDSRTFKRLMLQASTSIKAGVDVTDAVQDVVNEVTEERVIDLRRYGQKLNALAMFYMLFGVIFPSMGIAVATIMSTFISIFPITYVVLVLALVFIGFVQFILLNVMKNSRPIFAM